MCMIWWTENLYYNKYNVYTFHLGHEKTEVRAGILDVVTSLCSHSHLTNSAAMLLLSYINDPDINIRQHFSKLIG